MRQQLRAGSALLAIWLASVATSAEVIPHRQTKPPNPARTPAEAVAAMTLPPGFSVEVVAAEPDIVNPVAMTFDERGRVWITESLEYPRQSAGPGRDRVKVLEDTNGDGKADKFTVFAEGLNIPSGIAVGHGGVWVANSPDILFLQDTNGDGKADKQEVVVTGFGRDDTHELPNSLTWGPDGWLYGLNGVFNPSHINYRGKTYNFTCALFRIHPKTRDFEVFCEGTSNPWGIAYDPEGSAFVSACVIDHLWHLTQSGYYHRQGGPYPPHTWKIESIVSHRHQLAAYCGLHYYDSDAYPAEYREQLYMGNIHGNCINRDRLERRGSTYQGEPNPDFLSANDAWFMPVVQKTGPDGSLYILDWYDRYHCYQDARRDPGGIDRLKGRLYRVRYNETPRPQPFDLAQKSNEELTTLLGSPNGLFRDLSRRLLQERMTPELSDTVMKTAFNPHLPKRTRLNAVWAVLGGTSLADHWHTRLLAHDDPTFRAWGVRAAGNMGNVSPAIRDQLLTLATDASPDVRLQVLIAASRLRGYDAVPLLIDRLFADADDKLIPKIAWRNLSLRLDGHEQLFLDRFAQQKGREHPALTGLWPIAFDQIVAQGGSNPSVIVSLFQLLLPPNANDPAAISRLCDRLAEQIQTGQIAGEKRAKLKETISPLLHSLMKVGPGDQRFRSAAFLLASWNDPDGLSAIRTLFTNTREPEDVRIKAMDALIAAKDESVVPQITAALGQPKAYSASLRERAIASLGRLDSPRVADALLSAYPTFDDTMKPKAIELLTQRASWSSRLLDAIDAGMVEPSSINVNQLRRLFTLTDAALVARVKARFGSVRLDRNPDADRIITEVRGMLRDRTGDPHAGHAVFKKVCGQCHKIYGEGQEVGPDITGIGRTSFELLLSNVFDPSLVIGPAYQARIVQTADGRILTGLLVEETPQRVVLKLQGGKLETVARDDVESLTVSKTSLMPEGLEKQLTAQELADLFAFLSFDRPPSDPAARKMFSTQEVTPRRSDDPKQFNEMLASFAPGFQTKRVGEGGLAILAEHRGLKNVIRTHPVSQQEPCRLTAKLAIPAGKKSHLHLIVGAHAPKANWQLRVLGNDKRLLDRRVADVANNAWHDINVDLTPFAGQSVTVTVENAANDWSFEFGYFHRIELISE